MAVVMVPGTAEVAQHRELLIVEGATERSAATFDHVRDALVSSDADLTSLALHCSGAKGARVAAFHQGNMKRSRKRIPSLPPSLPPGPLLKQHPPPRQRCSKVAAHVRRAAREAELVQHPEPLL